MRQLARPEPSDSIIPKRREHRRQSCLSWKTFVDYCDSSCSFEARASLKEGEREQSQLVDGLAGSSVDCINVKVGDKKREERAPTKSKEQTKRYWTSEQSFVSCMSNTNDDTVDTDDSNGRVAPRPPRDSTSIRCLMMHFHFRFRISPNWCFRFAGE